MRTRCASDHTRRSLTLTTRPRRKPRSATTFLGLEPLEPRIFMSVASVEPLGDANAEGSNLAFSSSALGDPRLGYAAGFDSKDELYAENIAIDRHGNSYTVGSFSGTVDFDPGPGRHKRTSAGEFDGFLTKLDPAGNLLWTISFGNEGFDDALDVAVDGAGNVYLTGTFQGTVDFDPGPGKFKLTGHSYGDAYAMKLDGDGNLEWVRQFTASEGGVVWSSRIGLDDVGNVYLSGNFEGTVDFNPGVREHNITTTKSRFYLSKLDPNGRFLWARSAGWGGDYTVTSGLAIDRAGNAYMTGYFDETNGSNNLFVLKYKRDGKLRWKHQFTGTGSTWGETIAVDDGGNVLLAGIFNGTMDFDPGAGTKRLTARGVAGFLLKLDGAGKLLWAGKLSTTGEVRITDIAVDRAGNFYTIGHITGRADLAPGPGTHWLSSAGERDVVLSKLDSHGNLIWAQQFGGRGNENGWGIAVSDRGDIYATGNFEGNVGFNPGSGIARRHGKMFILKLTQAGK